MVKTLKQAEEILKIISENGSDLIVVTDIQGKRVSANSAYEEFIGDAVTMVGTEYFREVHPDDKEQVKSHFQTSIESGTAEKFTYRLILSDGSTHILESKIIRIFDEKKRPINLIIFSRDITELVQSQKELRLLAHAVGCTKDAFTLTDLKNNILYVNPATCEMYGYTEEDLIGKNVNILRSPNNHGDLNQEILQATIQGGWNGELFNCRKDGTEFPVELWTSVVHDDAGELVGMVGVARDLSKRRHAEEQLQATANRLQLTLDNLNIIAYELDKDGKFVLSRGKGLEKLGLKPDQIVGESLFDVYREYPTITEALMKAYKGNPQQFEVEVGGVVWSANFIPMKNADGKIEQVFGTAVDITERKRVEERLSHETELWHTLMDNIPDTIYFKDLHSRFTEINKAQCQILGIQNAEDAIGKTDADFFAPEHAKKALTDEKQVIISGMPMLGRVEKVTTKGGRVRWFSTTKVPMHDKRGDIIGIIGSSRDITEIKQAEELESALYRIADETNSAADLHKLFTAIHSIISVLMYTRNFYIALYDKEKDILSFPYFVDEVDVVPPEPSRVGRGLTAYILRSGKSLLCDKAMSDELKKSGEAELVGAPSPIWLGVPLVVEGKTIGAMVVQHYSDPKAYGEHEKQILEFVSTQVAKAIDRKQTADALRESEDRYRAFVEQSSEGIWRFDSDPPIPITLPEEKQIALFYEGAYIAECNDAMAQMYGFSRASDFVGTKLRNMLVPDDPQNLEVVRSFIRSGYRLINAETREFDKDGDVKIFTNNLVGIIEDGALRGAWGTQLDVTDRRQAEERLKQSEEKYRTLFEDSQDCIILSTPEGRLVDINPAGVELFGYSSKEEMLKVGHARELYYNPDDRDTFMSHLAQHAFVKDLEIAVKRKDGDKRIVLENSSTIHDVDGNVVGYRSFLRDMTERKNLEDQLRQSQKMEGIGTLAGGIAHEFNNLLGIILGYASILETGKQDQQRVVQGVETIKKAVQRGADLVRQLLTFARKGETTFGSVDGNEIVTELIEMLRQTFPKTITISSRLEENLPPIVADSSQLHLALLNLCVNARDAMIDEKASGSGVGTLTIETRIIKGDLLHQKFPDASADDYVAFRVNDTGIGMDEETRSRMFEPFFTTKGLGKGTGLGLAVAYGVINSHHGYVDVESTKGIGTNFTLYFPAAERISVAEILPKEKEQPTQKGNETILIVEDEEMLANLLKGILEDQGYKVITANDGQDGLEKYQQNKDDIQIILSDMGLPRLGGYEMFMKMKELNPNVKAILASGYFEPNLKIELVNAGAKDFIQKPYVTEIIIQRIREVLDEK